MEGIWFAYAFLEVVRRQEEQAFTFLVPINKG